MNKYLRTGYRYWLRDNNLNYGDRIIIKGFGYEFKEIKENGIYNALKEGKLSDQSILRMMSGEIDFERIEE